MPEPLPHPGVYPVLTAAQMQEADRFTIEHLGLPGIALMDAAGRGAADYIVSALDDRGRAVTGSRVLVLCGGGNNGGDGYVIARELVYRGAHCDVVLLTNRARVRGDALVELEMLERIIEEKLAAPGSIAIHRWRQQLDDGAEPADLLASLVSFDVVVDAIFGTGLTRDVGSPYREVIEAVSLPDDDVLVAAVDIPSGVSADDGQVMGCAIAADLTVTFGASKVGHWLHPGRSLRSELAVVDIGIPPGAIAERARCFVPDDASIAAMVPDRPSDGHKGTFGHVLAIGGAEGRTGAVALTCLGALNAGAGLVTAGTGSVAAAQLAGVCPEAMTEVLFGCGDEEFDETARRASVLALGPGMGTSDQAARLLSMALDRSSKPLVFDADALNLVACDGLSDLCAAASTRPVVLTPHPGEFARLVARPMSEVLRDPLGLARELAAETGAVVVLKMATTVVADADGRACLNATGNSGMGTAGSGDVLTGVVAALLGAGVEAWDAAIAAVYLHGRAGDLAAEATGERAVTATKIVSHLGAAFASVARAR